MVLDAYQGTIKIADLYYLKDGVSVKSGDVAVKTGAQWGVREIVDRMSKDYNPNDVVGVFDNTIAADFTAREITILVHGPANVKVTKDVLANEALMGASNRLTELFDGDGGGAANQQIQVAAMPVDAVISIIEDPTGTPQAYTPVTTTPIANQYRIDDLEKGLITLGLSVTGTDNYEIIYDIESGALEPLISDTVEVDIVVTTHIGNTKYPIDIPFEIDATAGSSTGVKTVIYSGSPSAGEVLVDRDTGTLTFEATDAVTEAKATYKTQNKSCARAIQNQTAGEKPTVFVTGVD